MPEPVEHAIGCATTTGQTCNCKPPGFERRILVTEAIANALGITPHPRFGYPANVYEAAEAVIALDPPTEYRYGEILGGTLYTYGPESDEADTFPAYEAAAAARIEETDVIVERTKPGEWQVVSRG